MSAVVQEWIGELGKLREKVLARRPLLSRAKEEIEKAVEMEANKKNRAGSVQNDSATMSEATVFLLMDRFVPW